MIITMHLCPIIAIALLTCSISAAESNESTYTSVVQTSKGPVRGKILNTARRNIEYASFEGIPYAKPPVGDLRFQPPVEIENWSNVFDADKAGNVCVQFYTKNSSIIGSENCLFLNVYTPHTNFTEIDENNLKPVMVWIYGGGFSTGANTYQAGPDFILEEGVVMAAMNYRLGPLGFLNLNIKNASGNMGLKDQNLALKWVKKNIAKFGGDPSKITIFGQSAGSASVDCHILSDMSAGLFNQSICMSGSTLGLFWGMQTGLEAHLQAKSLVSKLGSKAESSEEILKVLKNASAVDIVAKASELLQFPLPFRPTIERISDVNNEKFLSKCSIDKYHSGDYNKGPHMLGFTSNEGRAVTMIADVLKSLPQNKDTLKNASLSLNDPLLERFSNSNNVFEAIEQGVLEELSKSLADLLFVTSIDSKQKLLLQHNKHPIYYYRFAFESDLPNKINNRRDRFNISGVGHADDLLYLFYVSPIQFQNDNPKIELTINRYVRLFTNFAKYGNPTPNGAKDDLLKVNWPDSGILGLHLEIDKELTVGPRPISLRVVLNELLGLGTSRILNDCF